MEHQFNDSGAKGLVILANMAAHAQDVIPHTGIEEVIITELGDMHAPLKGHDQCRGSLCKENGACLSHTSGRQFFPRHETGASFEIRTLPAGQ